MDTSTTIKASSIAVVGDNIIEAAIASYIIEAEASAVVIRSSATRVVKPAKVAAIAIAITVIDIVAEEPTMGIKAIVVDTFTVRAIDSTTK